MGFTPRVRLIYSRPHVEQLAYSILFHEYQLMLVFYSSPVIMVNYLTRRTFMLMQFLILLIIFKLVDDSCAT